MIVYLLLIVIGIILIITGISNIKGNIDSIHSYHRNRVTEDDKKVFGKLMGTGTIVCGTGIIISGVLFFLSTVLNRPELVSIGSYITIISLIASIAFMIYATAKYNKGVF